MEEPPHSTVGLEPVAVRDGRHLIQQSLFSDRVGCGVVPGGAARGSGERLSGLQFLLIGWQE